MQSLKKWRTQKKPTSDPSSSPRVRRAKNIDRHVLGKTNVALVGSLSEGEDNGAQKRLQEDTTSLGASKNERKSRIKGVLVSEKEHKESENPAAKVGFMVTEIRKIVIMMGSRYNGGIKFSVKNAVKIVV